jgi:ATP-dependent helicase/nuclease subunit A
MSLPEQDRELKPEQAAAAYTLDRHVSVTAGPGSGKTTVLVERFLHILRQTKNLDIDQIVAITFTNRAANQMRERLRKKLDRILHNSQGPERQRWMRYKRTLDGAVIDTIHGFCARLLREFPVEAGIDPQFLLLDAHDAAILLEAAVAETLAERISAGNQLTSEIALGFGRRKLAEALVQLYWNVRGQGLRLEQLKERTAQSHATPESHRLALDDLERTIDEYLSSGRLTVAAETKRNHASRNWPALRELLLAEEVSLAGYCAGIESFRSGARSAKSSAVGTLMQKLDAQLWGTEKKGPLGLVPQICFDLQAKKYALEVIDVLAEVELRYRGKKRELTALDFDDLQLRALELLDQTAVLSRVTQRYRYFLVDEFQDTNSVQRELMHKLALNAAVAQANIFIVGDRKQSVYGFRGADVDVFQQTTAALAAAGGLEQPLHLNFRSQPPLIHFFNQLFAKLFARPDEVKQADLGELGFVAFEPSVEQLPPQDSAPLVELLIDTKSPADDSPKSQRTQAERDAKQVAQRIRSLVDDGGVPFRDIALLFRAMTDVPAYEAVLRNSGIPFQTVQGKGFYEREEITDLIQLLRYLDNKTDEIALAAVLRSPLCGLSDNTLLALRCAPWLSEVGADNATRHFSQPRKLVYALKRHADIAYIKPEEQARLASTGEFLSNLSERRNHYPLADLLRFAVESSNYLTVIAANFDGAQRLANVQKLFRLAERFEHAGAHLIRDLVRYVEEFEAIGSREGEGQIDDSANAVRLMTIHQAKGLEFPVVIIPNLHHRSLKPQEHWYALDRHRGLTVKIPDGRGKQVAGYTLETFRERNHWREHFESLRLLYVAATRAENRLILSGVTDELAKLSGSADNWLKLIWQTLELQVSRNGIVNLGGQAQLEVILNLADGPPAPVRVNEEPAAVDQAELATSLATAFPLLQTLGPEHEELAGGLQRLSVTQLINYRRCPRQYYFDRLLHVPSAEQLAVWNDAEAPEPPANLTATLRGAVVHRFCETFREGDAVAARLQQSFVDVLDARRAQLADRVADINEDEALKELLPLVNNYLASDVYRRIRDAERMVGNEPRALPRSEAGLWSELSFRLRRPLGILTGTIDKLLVSPLPGGDGFEIEIIDFKTNRFARTKSPRLSQAQVRDGEAETALPGDAAPSAIPSATSSATSSLSQGAQFAFDFSNAVAAADEAVVTEPVAAALPPHRSDYHLDEQILQTALDYQLQLQAYALAVRELAPGLLAGDKKLRVTLHFLAPQREFQLAADLLAPEACVAAIDDAMRRIITSGRPQEFPVRTGDHCRTCNFLNICPAGREWLRARETKR